MSLRNRSAGVDFDDLLNEVDVEILEGEKILRIPKDFVYSIEQVREEFNEESISELSWSMEEHGQLQPIIVRPVDSSNKYQIHQGERRWRAALKSNKITHVDCIVRQQGTIYQQLAENIQREGLNAIELSRSIRKIKDSEKLKSYEIAEKLTVSKAYISMYENVLNAPECVLEAYRQKRITDASTIDVLRLAHKKNAQAVESLVSQGGDISRKDATELKAHIETKMQSITEQKEKTEPVTKKQKPLPVEVMVGNEIARLMPKSDDIESNQVKVMFESGSIDVFDVNEVTLTGYA